jgi:spore coat protein A, manganese oxidase
MRDNRIDRENELQGIERRSFLKIVGSGAVGAVLFNSGFAPYIGDSNVLAQTGALTKFTEQLPVPGVVNLTGGGTYSLSMTPGFHRFHTALPQTPTWGYGGAAYLGPTFEAMRGMPVTLQAVNALGTHPVADAIDTTLGGTLATDKFSPRVSLHLHGGNTEPKSDGHPEATFKPGASRKYFYHNDQEATTLWYHDHAMGITRLNVYAGLAGFYLLRDANDRGQPGGPLNLPTAPYEIPLVIQDKIFNPDGTLAYPQGLFGSVWAPEFFGDVAVVNGKVWPNLKVRRGLYRFRFLNGSNARFYNLRLTKPLPMFQIGSDGGLLNAPVALTQLLLAPGERADVLIDFSTMSAGTKVVLTNDAVVPYPSGPRAPRRGGMPLPDIMQFTVEANMGFTAPIPDRLRANPIKPLPAPVRVRNLTLVEVLDPVTGAPLKALLNNLPYGTTQIETPRVDTVEQWNIINTTGDTHPIHLHLVQFQVLNRQKFKVADFMAVNYAGLPAPAGSEVGPWPAPSADAFTYGPPVRPNANEAGWKDTVKANPGEITRLLVPFGAGAATGVPFGKSFRGDYVWHCHILEHEDNEMMLRYKVV